MSNVTDWQFGSIQNPFLHPSRLSISQLRFCGAVEFGSRALGVNFFYSDYDFAILRSSFDKLFENNKPDEFQIKHYFKVVPPKGNNTIVVKYQLDTGDYLDLLILEHKEHVTAIKRAVNSCTLHHPTHLRQKHRRIALFEKALLNEGFRTRWPVLISNWILKTF
jgi:hypothetical protein